jgi:hypothetical protein
VDLILLTVLASFGGALLFRRDLIVKVTAAVFLVLGLLLTGSRAGDFIRTMLDGAYGLFT